MTIRHITAIINSSCDAGDQLEKDADMEETLKRRLETAKEILLSEGAEEIWLFGSWATGDANPKYSDIDLAVKGIKPENYFHVLGKLLYEIDCDVDLIMLDHWKDVRERGIFKEEDALRVA